MIFGFEGTSEVVEEAASQQRQQTRRSGGQRADHLLRFRAPAREANGSGSGESGRRADASRRRRQVRRRPSGVDGAFENSSLRLLVVHSEAVSALASDADRAVDWNLVCALDSSHAVECAICLEEPKAPVAGACGHIFCAACIVHHASMLEVSRSKRCPCCNRPLSTSELRPVRFSAVASVDEGAEHGVFVLLARNRQSRAAAPFCRRKANDDDGAMASSRPSLPVATLEKPECCVYSKLTVADSDDVVRGVFDKLSEELGAAAAAAESECAAQDVALAVAVMSSVRAAFLERNIGGRPPLHPDEEEDGEQPEDSKLFFFYGRADGEPTYLHPLALRCLLAAVDAEPALLPRTISLVAPPREVDRFEQCAESRRRLPWLGHIQLGCEVALLDCDLEALGDDWGPRAVQARDADPALLSAFAQRDERLKRDRERRRKAERKLRAKAAKGSPQLPDRATLDELRTLRSFALNDDDFAPLTTASPPNPGTLVLGASPEEPSFAALVAKGFAAELGCPALGSSSSRAQSPPSVWNRAPSAPDRALDFPPPEPYAPPPPERHLVSRDRPICHATFVHAGMDRCPRVCPKR